MFANVEAQRRLAYSQSDQEYYDDPNAHVAFGENIDSLEISRFSIGPNNGSPIINKMLGGGEVGFLKKVADRLEQNPTNFACWSDLQLGQYIR